MHRKNAQADILFWHFSLAETIIIKFENETKLLMTTSYEQNLLSPQHTFAYYHFVKLIGHVLFYINISRVLFSHGV